MIFNQSYYNAMDRGYYMSLKDEGQPSAGGYTPGGDVVPDIGLSPADIGISAPPFGDQLQALKAKIFQGASKVELGFMGRGKGSMQGGNTTPEMFGKDERMDIREIAKANKVQLTTHASPNAGSLAGFAQERFDEGVREGTLHEIEKAIDFAADTTNGGAVVIHAQEFQRPIYDKYFAKEGFQQYPEEREKGTRYLVDRRSGQMVPVRKNMPLYEPVYEEHPDDPVNFWRDIDGNRIPKTTDDTQLLFKRVPKWNAERSDFDAVRRDWGYFEERAKNWNNAHPDKQKTPEEVWFQIQIENQILRSKGSSLFYARQYEDGKETYEKAKKAYEFFRKVEGSMPKDEQWRLMQQTGITIGGLVPAENKLPSEILEKVMKDSEQNMRFIHEASASADAQARELQENIESTVPVQRYAEDKTGDTIVRAAMYAMDREKKTSREGLYGWDVRQGEKFEKPLFIAVENFFPEIHGGHPDEVRDIVINARGELASRLEKQRGMSRESAWKEAEQRIKATWDTSHANMWRKYFEAKPGESIEQADQRFRKWYLDKAKEWKDKGIIGHIHVDDNFGWEDEHVTPGQGNAPIKEFIQLMKDKIDKGEVNVIVEPAHQDYRALLGGWKLFGSSIYGLGMGRRDSWLDVERSYFGRNSPPYFLYGESAPDPEAWTLWSGTRME
ncbi:sugar phosphate isomerase/epimerase [Candidatus Woesearchaeota archaeon]|nr:sugar phosphate isomerase/epimerase [Candidatus Woesearchaeota archaeon]